MLKKLIQLFNNSILAINIMVLVALFIWSMGGLWNLVPMDGETLYWKIFITLIAILLFNLILVYCVIYLYRKNVKLTDLFSNSDHSRDYDAGELIFAEGDKEKVMYLVIKGEVEIFSEQGRLEIISPGGFFGEMAIIDNQTRTASARCIKYSRIIAIDEKQFYTMFSELPFFAKEIMRTLSHRLRRRHEQKEVTGSIHLKSR